MADRVTLSITVTLPNGYLTTLRNIGEEAAAYIAAQVRDAGTEADVICLVGHPQDNARRSEDR